MTAAGCTWKKSSGVLSSLTLAALTGSVKARGLSASKSVRAGWCCPCESTPSPPPPPGPLVQRTPQALISPPQGAVVVARGARRCTSPHATRRIRRALQSRSERAAQPNTCLILPDSHAGVHRQPGECRVSDPQRPGRSCMCSEGLCAGAGLAGGGGHLLGLGARRQGFQRSPAASQEPRAHLPQHVRSARGSASLRICSRRP
jgi:hypothetical protein